MKDIFFQHYQGPITVYWKQIETEKERVNLEKILTYLLRPKWIYEGWKYLEPYLLNNLLEV
jgi:hypothetical protein